MPAAAPLPKWPPSPDPLPGEGSAESEGSAISNTMIWLENNALWAGLVVIAAAVGIMVIWKNTGRINHAVHTAAAAVTAEVNKAVQGKQQTVNTIWMAMLLAAMC